VPADDSLTALRYAYGRSSLDTILMRDVMAGKTLAQRGRSDHVYYSGASHCEEALECLPKRAQI